MGINSGHADRQLGDYGIEWHKSNQINQSGLGLVHVLVSLDGWMDHASKLSKRICM